MKIVHLCLSCFYVDNFSYQENELVAQNIKDGHDVVVLASTETFGPNGKLIYVNASQYMGSDGAIVIRVPYRKFLPRSVMRKLRMHPDIYSILKDADPDVIYFHGICGWELLTVARYKKTNPKTRLYIDSHTDFCNSATGFFSKYFLHYFYYKTIVGIVQRVVDKILCVSIGTLDFAKDFYKVSDNKLEFYPLGGEVLADAVYEEERYKIRSLLGVTSQERIFLQSGKMDRSKKLLESLRAFMKLDNKNCKFLIVGSLQDDIKYEAEKIISMDPRIKFLGWKNPKELRALLCASDIYVQPGSQSATMQMSICCRCAVVLANVASHIPYVNSNGWLVDGPDTLENALYFAAECNNDELISMSNKSLSIASELLDYRLLAARIYR